MIQLKFQNDLSYQQIAEITKTTANYVGVLIHTALKTLWNRYGQASKDFVSFTPKNKERRSPDHSGGLETAAPSHEHEH